jgi:hypothetical protein
MIKVIIRPKVLYASNRNVDFIVKEKTVKLFGIIIYKRICKDALSIRFNY